MSAASIKAAAAKKRSSGSTANKNYATSLAGGGSVTVKDGVKTYSDKPLQVTGNNGISISGKSYSRNKGGTGFAPTVSATDIGTDSPILPVQEYGKDTGPINLSGSPTLNENGITVKDNQYVVEPSISDNSNAVKENEFSTQKMFDEYMGTVTDAFNQTKNQEADYLKREKKAGIQKFQQQVNDYTAEINSIVKNRDAAMLSLEGQGRGQTSGFIGGEQARINREAAIAALPVQAQLDAAQGNLTSATARLDKLFAIHQQDIQNEFSFKTSMAKSLLDFGTASQQNILNAKMADIKEAADKAQANLAYQRQLGLQALEYGQNNLITGISAIDPKSKTFEQDMARFTAQLRKPVTTTKMSDWELKDVNGVSMWVNKFTQEVKPAGDTAMAGVDGPGGELDKVALLRDTIERIKGRDANEELGEEAYDPLYKSASQTPFTEFFGRTFTGSSDLDNLKVYADTLKANMLTLAADPEIKKFFGPQMSNNDVQQMMAIASRLRPGEMKPEQLLSEVNRLETFVGKYEAAVKAKGGGYTQNSNVVVGADGYEYEIVD